MSFFLMNNEQTFYVKDRRDKDKIIKDAIFSLTGAKNILIKGEGKEISTAVEVAEILKQRMYPGIEITNISLGSRPFYRQNKKKQYNNKRNNQKDLISQIEITIKTKTLE